MIISYELVDDALCDLDDTLDCYEDCTQCPLFYDCMNIVENEEKEDNQTNKYYKMQKKLLDKHQKRCYNKYIEMREQATEETEATS